MTALIITLGLFAGLMIVAMAPGVLWGDAPDRRGEVPSHREGTQPPVEFGSDGGRPRR